MERTTNEDDIRAPIVALDLGSKRVGIAVSDALAISISRLTAVPRASWKQLLRDVADLVQRLDAKTVVIGLPLRLNGSSGDAAAEARETARKFARSLGVPVYLQDERLSSREAEENLLSAGIKRDQLSTMVDSEAAAVILRDFLQYEQSRNLVPRS
jgi:putative Holliday junction resolvase